jgi:hypothetical protein
MKMRQNLVVKQTLAAVLGCTIAAGLSTRVNATSVTVTDVTDWGTTPMEIVNANLPSLGYDGGVYAGINTLSVTGSGADDGVYGGFCIDPFHWSASGPTAGYSIVPLGDAPKSPGTLNASTTLQIEDLWAEFYSPTMSSPSAAGLQIAIWELVSSNAVASHAITPSEAVTFSGNTFSARADIASLATYTGPAADLEGLTGPGQDYVIDIPVITPPRARTVPDGGATFMMLFLSLGTIVLARHAIVERASQFRKLQPIRVNSL